MKNNSYLAYCLPGTTYMYQASLAYPESGFDRVSLVMPDDMLIPEAHKFIVTPKGEHFLLGGVISGKSSKICLKIKSPAT